MTSQLVAIASLLFAAGASASSPLTVTSPAFKDGAPIPKLYTGEGANKSPPLDWTGVPGSARELEIICEDPDAPGGTWIHWVLAGVPASTRSLPAGLPTGPSIASPIAALQGVNSFDTTGYGGPLPPPGSPPHHYLFHLYAVDTKLSFTEGSSASALRAAMKGHIVAEGKLVGTFHR